MRPRRAARLRGGALALAAAVALTACAPTPPEAVAPGVTPQARPADRPATAPSAPPPSAPSDASRALAGYYTRLEADLVAQGLLRTDGGGPDTPITDSVLVRDFEQIALAEEYARGGGLNPSDGALGRVKKWTRPVRVTASFGATVPQSVRSRETGTLERYVARLARVTDHPITMTARGGNFDVLFLGADDPVVPRVRALVPNIDPASLAVLGDLPRSIHCLVIAFADDPGGYSYGRAIAVIRAEHPPLLMKSCIHEEIAQGLGLANDSPRARPSIFNDDDEFALLTTHDEYLLQMLYDPALKPGMTAAEARPIIRIRAAQLADAQVASLR